MNKIPLIENACKELLSYGVWDGRTRCKHLVKRYLLRRETVKEDLIFWPTGLLAAGLWTCREELIKGGQKQTETAESAETQQLIKMIENALAAYYGRWLKKKYAGYGNRRFAGRGNSSAYFSGNGRTVPDKPARIIAG